MKSFFKKLFSFRFTKKRVLIAILLVIGFIVIGIVVDRIYKYFDTPESNYKKDEKKLESKIDLKDKIFIDIKRYDLDKDGIEDYVAISGKQNTEQYSNLDVIFLNGKTDEILKYSSKKEFAKNVELDIYEDKDKEYIFIRDTSSGNVLLLRLKENEFENIINNSFGDTFKGYTIDMVFDEKDQNVLNISLDNYGKEYLKSSDKTYKLDFKDKNVDLNNYRGTYNLDKFQKVELKDLDNDGIFELVASQYILYLYKNVEDCEDNLGIISTTFKYIDDKFVFDNVKVEI